MSKEISSQDPGSEGRADEAPDPGQSDEERPADEKLMPRPAPGIGPIGPAGDPAYMEGTLEGKGPRRGLYLTIAVLAVIVLVAIALVLGG